METLSEALARLERLGFRDSLRARPGGLLGVGRGEILSPETLVIEEIIRFEGQSDPDDEAVLFALRSFDGRVRGTFVAAYGVPTDPDCAAVMERLDATLARTTCDRDAR